VKLAETSAEAIAHITASIQPNVAGGMFLLGDRYIDALKKLSGSENSKFVVYPADLQEAIRGLFKKAQQNVG